MTKPSYEDEMAQLKIDNEALESNLEAEEADNKRLKAELARVRGLLQRQWVSVEERERIANEMLVKHGFSGNTVPVWKTNAAIVKAVKEALATFPQSSSLVPEGAESADIGKLDSGDESGKVNRVGEVCNICGKKKMKPFPAGGMFIMMANHYYCIGACAGSAETGGEKA
jgi:hypothetical protein